MKLGPKFSRQILDGDRPALTDEPDLVVGQIIDILSHSEGGARVSITVLKRSKANRWAYSVRDDRPVYLAAGGPPMHRHYKRTETGRQVWVEGKWPEEEERGYTRAPKKQVDGSDDVLDDEMLNRIHRERSAANSRQREVQRVRGEKIRLERRLRDATRPRTVKAILRRLGSANRDLGEAA